MNSRHQHPQIKLQEKQSATAVEKVTTINEQNNASRVLRKRPFAQTEPSSSSSSSSSISSSSLPTQCDSAHSELQFGFLHEWNVSKSALIHDTPSRKEGLTFDEEITFRAKCCDFLQHLTGRVIDLLASHDDDHSQEMAQRLKREGRVIYCISQVSPI